ncbi:hypothetical protein NKG05_02985 [Oerskovia sp. M15]
MLDPSGVRWSTRLLVGDTAQALGHLAETVDAAMIVVGTHERGFGGASRSSSTGRSRCTSRTGRTARGGRPGPARGRRVAASVGHELMAAATRPSYLRWASIGLVMIGGAFGAAGREGVSLAVPDIDQLPIAIPIVNIVGAFLLGYLYEAVARRLPGDPRGPASSCSSGRASAAASRPTARSRPTPRSCSTRTASTSR